MSSRPVYNLSTVPYFITLLKTSNPLDTAPDLIDPVDPDASKLKVKYYNTKSNQSFKIISYDKNFLSNDLIPTFGLFRSVIANSNNEIVGFAPPKSMPTDTFFNKYPNPSVMNDIIAEEFVEGTMINVFWNSSSGVTGAWEIATRSTVGAEVSFYKSANSKTFKQMFLEASQQNNLVIEQLNKKMCYSFVMQHHDNRIVTPFKTPQLYLVAVYEIEHVNNTISVYMLDMDAIKSAESWTQTTIKFPQIYSDWTSYKDLIDKYASSNTIYSIMGVIIKSKVTHDRCKVRNPGYEEVRNLRGNQSKSQYQYLQLRKNGKLSEFLKFYPEFKKEFSVIRDQLHLFTNTLFQNYLSCYIRKEKPLLEFPGHFRPHMFKIHEKYRTELKEQGLYVTNTVVKNYVNEMHPSQQMFTMNYNMRKRNIDIIKNDV
jgi:hypothetical protein